MKKTVGADAHIGPKGSIFDPFGTIGTAHNWRLLLHELRTFMGCGPMWASAPTNVYRTFIRAIVA